MNNQIFQLKILTPNTNLYQGVVQSVSSINSKGKFDILALHANFITLVESKPITVVDQQGNSVDYNFNEAIIVAKDNEVSIFADPESS